MLLSGPEIFQTAGSSIRLIGKTKANELRTRPDRRRTSNKKDVKDSSSVTCPAEPTTIDAIAARRWTPFTFSRRRRHRQRRHDPEGEGQSNSVEDRNQGHSDLEMTLNGEQHWLDVDLLRNDAANDNSITANCQ